MSGMADWERLGKMVIDRRLALGLRTRDQAAIATGISVRLLADLELGARDNYEQYTLVRLEQGIGWLPGSVDAVLAGGYPSLLPGTVGAEIDPVEAEMAIIRQSDLPDAQKQAILEYTRQLAERQRAERRAEVERLIDLAKQLRAEE